MSCPHPQVAQFLDRTRGTVTCSLCGEVVNDQQLELDPAFARGERPGGTGGRHQPGFARPMRSTILTNPAAHRPSIENARRSMLAIARKLEISADHAEMAVGIFKLAVNTNAVSGSRAAVLCACLYAICRREHTPHMLFDFADATGEPAGMILTNLKLICSATSTKLPSPDPSFYVQRLAQQLDLGPQTDAITILAVKVVRAMHAEWIGYGRRPLGLCGAAILVAANAFGVQRSVEDVVSFVRLTAGTILLRMGEFLNTDAARIEDIDRFQPSSETLPPAFDRPGVRSADAWVSNTSEKRRADLYYQLVSEARAGAGATEERQERWKEFIEEHSASVGEAPDPSLFDLAALTPAQQLSILGHENAVVRASSEAQQLEAMERKKFVVQATRSALALDEGSNHSGPRSVPPSPAKGGGFASFQMSDADNGFGMFSSDADEDEFAFVATPVSAAPPAFPTPDLTQEVDSVHSLLGAFEGLRQLNSDVVTQVENIVERASFDVIVLPDDPIAPVPEDLARYVITDLEQRLRLEQAGRQLMGAQWNAGAAKSKDEVLRAEVRACLQTVDADTDGPAKRGKKHRYEKHKTAADAIKAALRSRGGVQIDTTAVFGADDVAEGDGQEDNSEPDDGDWE